MTQNGLKNFAPPLSVKNFTLFLRLPFYYLSIYIYLKVSKKIETIFDHRLPDISTRRYSKPASIHECCCSTTTICWPNSNNDWRPTTARSRDIIKGQGRYHTLWTLSLGFIQHSVQSLENTFLQSWIISRFLKCLVVSKIT